MSKTQIVLFKDDSGRVPFQEWFQRQPEKVQDKCLVRIERLEEFGYELKRPEADYLRDDIYELRVKHQSVNYRILYFFHGRQLVVLSHGFSKQQAKVAESELKLAIRRRQQYTTAPERHTYKEQSR